LDPVTLSLLVAFGLFGAALSLVATVCFLISVLVYALVNCLAPQKREGKP
jgi:hypothetical protein